MGMNLIAAVTLLPITILTDSYFSPSLPLKTVDYAVIGLGLITVVAYTMFVLSVALLGLFFPVKLDTSSPLPVCFEE